MLKLNWTDIYEEEKKRTNHDEKLQILVNLVNIK